MNCIYLQIFEHLNSGNRTIAEVFHPDCRFFLRRSWPTLRLEQLSIKAVKELVRAELSSHGHSLTQKQEKRLLTHCRLPETCSPLYVVTLANDLAR